MTMEPIISFKLTAAEFLQLCTLARQSNPLHALPDDYVKQILIEHLVKEALKKEALKARRMARRRKARGMVHVLDTLTDGEAP
jgi:hypothetical protein